MEHRVDEAYERLGALDKKTKATDPFGADLKWLADTEKQMEDNVRRAEEEAKKAKEKADDKVKAADTESTNKDSE